MRWPWQKQNQSLADEAARREAREAAGLLRVMLDTRPVPGLPSPDARSIYPLYAFDNPIWYSTPQAPTRRPGTPVTTQTLRQMADSYDVLRACIQHLKREVHAVPLKITAKEAGDHSATTARRLAEAEAFFGMGGGLGGVGKMRADFEGQLIEDVNIIGAAAIYYAPTLGGRPHEVVAIDAATIRPSVDAWGWPGPGAEVYEQWVLGIKVAGFTREQLTYCGLPTHARSYMPYYASPVEWLIHVVNSALRADEWNRRWLTDGNTPSDLIALPQEWTPDQVKNFTAYWDAMLSGDSAQRQKTRFVPSGSQRVGAASRKDQDFQAFELWLLRRTCAILGVQPASVGFAGEQYKVSQQDSMESTSAFGVGVFLDWRKALYDDLLMRLGYSELEVRNVTAQEEKATERATRNSLLVAGGILTPNEARAEEGRDPIAGGDTLRAPK